VEVARQEGAEAICHGATGKGNDQVRFEQSAFALEPEIRIISPWREWSFEGRSDLIEYARQHKIPVEATAEKPYSVDQNLLHISYEGGILEDPWQAPPADMFRMSTDPMLAPDQPQEVEISFEAGLPVAVDGEALEPMALLQKLNEIAGAHGVGRIDIVENRAVGLKSRGVYETPGGTVLHLALRAVESMALDREQIRLLDDLAPRFATMIYDGFWFAPEREALSAMVDEIQKHTTGVARIRLYKGSAMITGRKAQRSLYDARLASFESDQGAYDQADAEGFIKLRSLRLRTRALQERKLQ
jgi:argininosuccinate synthase